MIIIVLFKSDSTQIFGVHKFLVYKHIFFKFYLSPLFLTSVNTTYQSRLLLIALDRPISQPYRALICTKLLSLKPLVMIQLPSLRTKTHTGLYIHPRTLTHQLE